MRNRVYALFMMLLTGVLMLSTVELQAQDDNPIRRVSAKRSRTRTSRAASSSDGSVRKVHVTFNPTRKRDPMLSNDDLLLLEHREKQRLAALEAERKRKEEEERRRRAEEERKRQWELMLLKDPTILVRDKIRIDGIIDKEVLIGGKLYTIGNTYQGCKIVAVGSDSVTFSYKGHKFVKKLNL